MLTSVSILWINWFVCSKSDAIVLVITFLFWMLAWGNVMFWLKSLVICVSWLMMVCVTPKGAAAARFCVAVSMMNLATSAAVAALRRVNLVLVIFISCLRTVLLVESAKAWRQLARLAAMITICVLRLVFVML